MDMRTNRNFTFTIEFTEKCNLACKYCYVPQITEVISEKVLLAIIEQAKHKIDDGCFVGMDIFGGEPLLVEDRVRFFIDQLAALEDPYKGKFRVTVFTNATLLTEEFVNYTHQYKFVNYNFSLDGGRECHNAARVYHDGRGSYDDVVSGIEKYSKVYGIPVENIYGKFLISPFNLQYFMPTIQELLKSNKHVIAAGIDRDAVWTDEDVDKYEKVIYEVADFYIEHIGQIERIDLFVIPILDYEYTSYTYCAAGKSQWGIAPNGDIYPCQRFYNNRSPYILGNVFDGVGGKWYQMFQAYNAKCFRACHTCDMFTKFNCLGQCISACYENGDIFKAIPNVCKILKITYQAAKYVDDNLKGNSIYDSAMDRIKNMKG